MSSLGQNQPYVRFRQGACHGRWPVRNWTPLEYAFHGVSLWCSALRGEHLRSAWLADKVVCRPQRAWTDPNLPHLAGRENRRHICNNDTIHFIRIRVYVKNWPVFQVSDCQVRQTGCNFRRSRSPQRIQGARKLLVRRVWRPAGCWFIWFRPLQDTTYLAPAARRVLASSMARVMGPTPPGTGVMYDALSTTASKSTSPTIFPFSSRLMPTSMTTAPCFT